MIANTMLAVWAVIWCLLFQLSDTPMDRFGVAAVMSIVGFPSLCVFAARHLP